MNSKKLKVGVIGATGYTGVELLRLLLGHGQADIHVITSNAKQGKRITEVLPSLWNLPPIVFAAHDSPQLNECDVAFFATPSGIAMHRTAALLDAGVKVIDLSADFRLRDAEQWTDWYGESHGAPELLTEAVYGLPELNRLRIKDAVLVANPGCYPTAVLLGLLPVLEAGMVNVQTLVADVKSGISGAGRRSTYLFSESSETLKAYNVTGHRHLPEICQQLRAITDTKINLTFVPHLVPMVRGILATLYTEMTYSDKDIEQVYSTRYAAEIFIDVLPSGSCPDTRSVRGTNRCRIAVHKNGNRLIVLSVIDNLVKGAAGQAVQNMNIMFGLDEALGLDGPALYP